MQANNDQKEFWNSIYSNPKLQFPKDDGFLSMWVDKLRHAKRIIDLGCGNGVNTFFLRERGIQAVACDFSEPALNLLITKIPDANVLLFDMIEGLPFLTNNIDVVIADLSLHYFTLDETKAVLNEINRVLAPNGLFLSRVNALVEDMSSQGYREIEKDYYVVDGCKKRFFSIDSLAEIMNDFRIEKIYMQETTKYRSEKRIIVCEAYKRAESY